MSTNNKYIQKKEDLDKFDKFIQDTLDKFIFVKPWKELYLKTGKDAYDIISNKSTIPDLVIYNKSFNKNDCFYYSNKNNKNIKFPRVKFLLRPKKIKYDNPYIEEKGKKEEENPINNNINNNTNNNNINNYNFYKNFDYQKLNQYIQFQNHVNNVLGNLYILNKNNQPNKFNNFHKEKKELIKNININEKNQNVENAKSNNIDNNQICENTQNNNIKI